MQTRTLGWTGLQLTTIGLGTWAMGGSGWAFSWGPQEDRDSIRTIHHALSLGINWIDTAPAYGLGHAEEIIGHALAGMAQRPIIATKCGRSWNDQGHLIPVLKKEAISSEIEASLRRLRVDVIDLYQIHWPQPAEDIEEAWSVIAQAVQAGKIRYAGVSNFNVSQLRRIDSIHPVASLQPPYSLLAREAEDELLSYCAAQRIGVVVYSPMQKGLLTGKFTADRVERLPQDDHRRRDLQFRGPLLSANLELVESLQSLAGRHGRTVAQLAIAWVLRRSEVTAAIVGGRTPAQVDEVAPGADWPLPHSELQAIAELVKKRQATIS
jgi:aryl-alcohol dehydrogenase-like predicted oxidoreductase